MIKDKLLQGKYPPKLLDTAIQTVSNIDRTTLLKPKKKKKNQKDRKKKIRLVTFYNPNKLDFKTILRKYEDILYLIRKPELKPEDIQVTC